MSSQVQFGLFHDFETQTHQALITTIHSEENGHDIRGPKAAHIKRITWGAKYYIKNVLLNQSQREEQREL